MLVFRWLMKRDEEMVDTMINQARKRTSPERGILFILEKPGLKLDLSG